MNWPRPSPEYVLLVCVSCVLISCLNLSCLNGSQKWLDRTLQLNQIPLGTWWQGSKGHSFNSEIKWETCFLPSLPAHQWDPEDQATPGPEQSINQIKCHKTRRRLRVEVLLKSVCMCGYSYVCMWEYVWMSLCEYGGWKDCWHALKLKIW